MVSEDGTLFDMTWARFDDEERPRPPRQTHRSDSRSPAASPLPPLRRYPTLSSGPASPSLGVGVVEGIESEVAIGFFEGRDGQVRPGFPVAWPWRRFRPSDHPSASAAVLEGIAREFARPPAIRPGGKVVFASSRAEVVEVTAEEVAVVGPGGRTIPVTIVRDGKAFRLVKLGVFAWLACGMEAISRRVHAGAVSWDSWRDALFALCRVRVALERVEAFTPAALDWADQHGESTLSRAYAISVGSTGSAASSV